LTPRISDEEKGKRRLQIIQAAIEVFKRNGYEAATMQDIVDETGMSRGWVYIYFSSKEEIMHAIIAENAKEADAHYQALLASELSVWQGLSGLIDIMETQLTQTYDEMVIVLYGYFISGWRQPERRSFLEEHYKKQHDTLNQYLKRGVENGEFRPKVDLDVIIKMITSYFEGIMIHTYAAGSEDVRVKEQLGLFKSILKNVLQVKDLEGDS
jgi:AcrR family transcriptional regulator